MLRAAQSPPPSNQKAEIKATRLTLAPLKLRLLPPGAGCNEGPLRGRLAPDPGPRPRTPPPPPPLASSLVGLLAGPFGFANGAVLVFARD